MASLLEKPKPIWIVVEGLDATGKTTLVQTLGDSLSAQRMKCPPKLTTPLFGEQDLRSHFDTQNSMVRRSYYRAANLIACEMATFALKSGQNVVMDRYWPSTVSYSRLDEAEIEADNNKIEEQPSETSQMGVYPEELRKPDFVILLTVDEKVRVKRLNIREEGGHITHEENQLEKNNRGRNLVLSSYRTFADIEINTSDKTPDQVLQAALDELRVRGVQVSS